MTREEVIAKWNSMQLRERDAWVAEKVMGLELSDNMLAAYPKYRLPDYPDYFRDVPNYSTDISAAWEVLEHVKCDDYSVGGSAELAEHYVEFQQEGNYSQAHAKTVPEAICLAALIAQGEE